MDEMNKQVETLHDLGCVVQDIEAGLVSWYSKLDGEDIFLSWQHGEISEISIHCFNSSMGKTILAMNAISLLTPINCRNTDRSRTISA